MRRHLISLSAVTVFIAVLSFAAVAGLEESPLPIHKVVLYSSGVGYFEHIGSVSGTLEATLQFKTEQVNDILKSLVLEDLDGGKIGTVVYPSRDPVSKTLQSFQVDLSNEPALEQILAQLRGTPVSLVVGVDLVEGIILGVEKRLKALSNQAPPTEVPVVNILSGATVKSVFLDQITSLEIRDTALQAELAKALETLAQSRDQNKKPITLHFEGPGERRVRFGYLVETPVWKTSYRLVLPKEEEGDGQLQGWAIVENQTDHDWTGVELSLVSGRPISFIQDLYQPLYVSRPIVQTELYSSLTPERYVGGLGGGGVSAGGRKGVGLRDAPGRAGIDAPTKAPAAVELLTDSDDKRASAAREDELARKTPSPSSQQEAFLAYPASAAPINPAASVASAASAGQIGELFQYTVGEVSLPRQRSAMIPIVTDPIKVGRVSIYNRNTLASNPLLGARLTNTTGKHLLQGPMTVFDEGAYAGDSQIDNLPPGQNRLLSYAIDLKVHVNSTTTHDESRVVSGKIVKGVLEISNKSVSSRDYVIANQDEKHKTLIVEHPIRGDWKLVDTPKPTEKTDSVYRFTVPVVANSTTTLVVKEEMVASQMIAILPLDLGQMEYYTKAGEIPDSVRKELAKAMQTRREIADTERAIEEHNTRIKEITTEQERIRANMASNIDSKSQYYNRLLTKLNEQETTIEGLQKEMVELQAKLAGQRKQLEQYLGALTVQ